MSERYLDPKNDLTFKKVFGEHPDLLRSFLNALLPLKPDQQIVELEYLPAELVPNIPILKNTIVDVRCKDRHGRVFIVEMQVLWTDSFMQRVLFNASKAYVKQIKKGQEYKFLQPVYSLNLIDDTFSEKPDRYYHHYQIVNIENTSKQLEGLEFVFVELPNFKAKTWPEKKLQILWLRFLTEISDDNGTQVISQELLDNPEIRQALEIVRESAFSAEELETYDKYWDQVSVERSRLEDTLVKGFTKGEQIGLEKGEQIGLEKGEQIGLEKGEQIGLEKGEQIGLEKGERIGRNKTVLKMLRQGISEGLILDLTGVSEQELQALRHLLEQYKDKAEDYLDPDRPE